MNFVLTITVLEKKALLKRDAFSRMILTAKTFGEKERAIAEENRVLQVKHIPTNRKWYFPLNNKTGISTLCKKKLRL